MPPIAELKMLREMQEEVNNRTRNLYDALEASGDDELNPLQQRILRRLTSAQTNIRELLQSMNDTLMEQAQGAAGGDGDGDGDGEGEGEGQEEGR